MNAEIIGRHIREYREKNGLTQKQLAEKLYVSDRTISRWERGNGLPDIDELPRIARLLGMNLNELVGEPSAATGTDGDAPDEERNAGEIAAAAARRRRDVFFTVISFVCVVFLVSVIFVMAAMRGAFDTVRHTFVFEAEDALFSDSFRVEDVEDASGGKVAAWLHTAGTTITFKVVASRAARATLGIRVNRPRPFVFEDKMRLEINGMPYEVGVVPGLGFDGSEEELFYKFGDPVTTEVMLGKGDNKVTITVLEGENLNIDCLEFTTTADLYLSVRDITFEAENADVNGLYSLIDSHKASGGIYVGDTNVPGTTVNFSVRSDMDAFVTMRIYVNHPFDTSFESKYLLTVNGESVTVGHAKGTGYPGYEDTETDFTSPFTVGIGLRAGDNVITFTSVAGANFDRISFYTSLDLTSGGEAD